MLQKLKDINSNVTRKLGFGKIKDIYEIMNAEKQNLQNIENKLLSTNEKIELQKQKLASQYEKIEAQARKIDDQNQEIAEVMAKQEQTQSLFETNVENVKGAVQSITNSNNSTIKFRNPTGGSNASKTMRGGEVGLQNQKGVIQNKVGVMQRLKNFHHKMTRKLGFGKTRDILTTLKEEVAPSIGRIYKEIIKQNQEIEAQNLTLDVQDKKLGAQNEKLDNQHRKFEEVKEKQVKTHEFLEANAEAFEKFVQSYGRFTPSSARRSSEYAIFNEPKSYTPAPLTLYNPSKLNNLNFGPKLQPRLDSENVTSLTSPIENRINNDAPVDSHGNDDNDDNDANDVPIKNETSSDDSNGKLSAALTLHNLNRGNNINANWNFEPKLNVDNFFNRPPERRSDLENGRLTNFFFMDRGHYPLKPTSAITNGDEPDDINNTTDVNSLALKSSQRSTQADTGNFNHILLEIGNSIHANPANKFEKLILFFYMEYEDSTTPQYVSTNADFSNAKTMEEKTDIIYRALVNLSASERRYPPLFENDKKEFIKIEYLLNNNTSDDRFEEKDVDDYKGFLVFRSEPLITRLNPLYHVIKGLQSYTLNKEHADNGSTLLFIYLNDHIYCTAFDGSNAPSMDTVEKLVYFMTTFVLKEHYSNVLSGKEKCYIGYATWNKPLILTDTDISKFHKECKSVHIRVIEPETTNSQSLALTVSNTPQTESFTDLDIKIDPSFFTSKSSSNLPVFHAEEAGISTPSSSNNVLLQIEDASPAMESSSMNDHGVSINMDSDATIQSKDLNNNHRLGTPLHYFDEDKDKTLKFWQDQTESTPNIIEEKVDNPLDIPVETDDLTADPTHEVVAYHRPIFPDSETSDPISESSGKETSDTKPKAPTRNWKKMIMFLMVTIALIGFQANNDLLSGKKAKAQSFDGPNALVLATTGDGTVSTVNTSLAIAHDAPSTAQVENLFQAFSNTNNKSDQKAALTGFGENVEANVKSWKNNPGATVVVQAVETLQEITALHGVGDLSSSQEVIDQSIQIAKTISPVEAVKVAQNALLEEKITKVSESIKENTLSGKASNQEELLNKESVLVKAKNQKFQAAEALLQEVKAAHSQAVETLQKITALKGVRLSSGGSTRRLARRKRSHRKMYKTCAHKKRRPRPTKKSR